MTEKRKTSDLVKRARAFRRFDRDCTCPGLISDLASRVDTLERQTDDASKILNLEDRWPELPIRALAERATNHLDGERVIAERRAERAEARVAQLEGLPRRSRRTAKPWARPRRCAATAPSQPRR
jgi:hypothetical protein